MNKTCLTLGFSEVNNSQQNPDIYLPTKIVEHPYYAEILSNTRKWTSNEDSTNQSIDIDNQFSIIGDLYVFDHLSHLKYVNYMGVYWEVKSIKPDYPRLIISVGGVYNGPTYRN